SLLFHRIFPASRPRPVTRCQSIPTFRTFTTNLVDNKHQGLVVIFDKSCPARSYLLIIIQAPTYIAFGNSLKDMKSYFNLIEAIPVDIKHGIKFLEEFTVTVNINKPVLCTYPRS